MSTTTPPSSLVSKHWVGSCSIGQVVDENVFVMGTSNLVRVFLRVFKITNSTCFVHLVHRGCVPRLLLVTHSRVPSCLPQYPDIVLKGHDLFDPYFVMRHPPLSSTLLSQNTIPCQKYDKMPMNCKGVLCYFI